MPMGYLIGIRTSPRPHRLLSLSWFAELSNCWLQQKNKGQTLFRAEMCFSDAGMTHGVHVHFLFAPVRSNTWCPLHVHIPPLPSLYQGKNESQGPLLFQAQVKKGGFPTDLILVRKIWNSFWLARTSTSCTTFSDLTFRHFPPNTHTLSFLLPSKETLSFTLWLRGPERERTYGIREQRWEVCSILDSKEGGVIPKQF